MNTANLVLGLTWILLGLFMIGISIPLLKGKIKMNHWYGFRFMKSFESTENWYKINRYGAQRMILWSAVLMVLGIVILFLPPIRRNPIAIIAVLHAPLILLIAAVESWLYARKL